MKATHRETALSIIENEQGGNHMNGTSSVVVEIGGTSDKGNVEHGSLYVRDACSQVLDALRDAGFTLEADPDGGVQLHDYKLEGD